MNSYLLFKSLHLIAVIAWMAGLLYLPRILVYHVENINDQSSSNIFIGLLPPDNTKLAVPDLFIEEFNLSEIDLTVLICLLLLDQSIDDHLLIKYYLQAP